MCRNKRLFHLYFILIAALWVTGNGCSPAVKQKEKKKNAPQVPVTDPDKPKVNPEGPQPKMVLAEHEFKFGAMMVGERKTHTFIIKNEGEGVLKLHIGPASCGKCSKFTLKSTTVPPGEKTELEVEWFPFELDENFRKFAPLTTNENEKKIEIAIIGMVTQEIQLSEGPDWNLSSFQEGKPATLTRYIYSSVLDQFQVTGLETKNKFMAAKKEKMTAEELKKHHAKSGYAIHVTISPKVPVGKITEELVIKTDLSKKEKDKESKKPIFTVYVKGTRSGPLRFQALPGVVFRRREMMIDMKTFQGSKGRAGKLQIIINKAGKTPFKIESVESDSDILKVTIKKDEKFKAKDRMRFFLRVEVPAGSPSVNHTRRNMSIITIKTNHPDAKEIRLRVSFLTL
ncbi:hypothetical protein MNBD_PLANCTO02-191 [hydrothermal vent metagenome]|uniref:DUF1573 domain-containing protein n=2 Tax=hydrothermal vent metagenome TaxID=652676 RepID=A0A3B1DP76_9ZZZZ